MSMFKKFICSAIVILGLFSFSFGLDYEQVTGQISTLWVSPINGDICVYVQTNTVLFYSGGTLNNTYTITGPMMIIIPVNNGSNKNALACLLSARTMGLPVIMTFTPRSGHSGNSVTLSTYGEIYF
jgi:hypothetical protein